MISHKVAAAIAGVAVVGALGGGALALANGDDLVSPARVATSTSVGDDGTPDQGPGDAPGTAGANDDDSSGPGGNSGHGGDDDSSGPGGNSGQG